MFAPDRTSSSPSETAVHLPPEVPGAAAQTPPAGRRPMARVGSDGGMTTAEYAVGTVAACGFGAVLYKVVTSDQVANLLSAVIRRALATTF